MACNQDELLICALARTLAGVETVVVGSVSPLPAAAALLAQALNPDKTRAMVFLNSVNDPFPEAGSEIYDRIGQGRVEAFFLSGGQIDGQANLNNVGVGTYPNVPVRFPGSYGLPFIYFMVPRVILFREEHSPRALVQKVDFISAPGVTPPNIYRRGGPTDLVTSLASFAFDRKAGRFTLASVHPGHTVDEVVAETGFSFERSADVPETPQPSEEWLALLHGPVREQVAETYPTFAAKRLGNR